MIRLSVLEMSGVNPATESKCGVSLSTFIGLSQKCSYSPCTAHLKQSNCGVG